MSCNHSQATTPYCPHCGEVSSLSPLAEIVAFFNHKYSLACARVVKYQCHTACWERGVWPDFYGSCKGKEITQDQEWIDAHIQRSKAKVQSAEDDKSRFSAWTDAVVDMTTALAIAEAKGGAER